jgi:putative endonuclease
VKPGNTSPRRALGAFGEQHAAAHLQRHGYQLVARNWRCALGEIDLVARQGTTLVFVEVRTRRGASFGSPEESLTRAKRTRLVALAQAYLGHLATPPADWRIDLVAIDVDPVGRVCALRHLCHAVGED